MIVTINTDASFHPLHKVGAFAFWIVCNQGRVLKSGKLKSVTNSTDAEIKCIANALHTVLNLDFVGVTKIIINTDSLGSIQRITKRSKAGTPERHAFSLIRKIKKKYKVFGRPIHEFRHVKAHSGKETKRKYVNDWCDKQAKKHMRELIKNNGL